MRSSNREPIDFLGVVSGQSGRVTVRLIVVSGGMWPASVWCRPRILPEKKTQKYTAVLKGFF